MKCLDDNLALGFLEGRLSPARLAEVDAHLSSCESCRELVAASAAVVLSVKEPPRPAPAPATDRPSEVRLERGAAVGRYVVLDLVGRGAMGEVYAAFDPELNRKIALKLLHRGGAHGDDADVARRRLLREAKAIARLSDPNIVTVHDAGTIEGRVFIAMEFVEGQTAHEWARATPRAWREVLDVYLAAGRGLAAAHAAGIVHRDFKPHNMMVGATGGVRVMDFGLARDSDTGAGEEADAARPVEGAITATVGAAMTRTGTILGTPAYMAPEQFRAEPADARSDQFSFCVALYEGLYGERPFAGETVADLARNVSRGTVREAAARARVPARLRRLLLRGLRPARDERFPSMEALLAELARDPQKQRRRLALGAALALVLVAGGAVAQRTFLRPGVLCRAAGERLAGVWEPSGPEGATPRREGVRAAFAKVGGEGAGETWQRVSAVLDRYADAWTRMSAESCEATNVRGEQSAAVLDLRTACLGASLHSLRALTDVFTQADRGVFDEAVNAANALPELARCADVKALQAVTPLPEGREARERVAALRRRLAEVTALRDAGKVSAALPLSRALVADARATGYDPVIAETLGLQCWLEDASGGGKIASGVCEEVIWAAEASRHDAVGAEAAGMLSALAAADVEASRRWTSLARAILKRMGPGHERIEGWLDHAEATSAMEHGDAARARALYEKAIALKTIALGPDSPDVGLSLSNYGNTLHELGESEAALVELRRARATFERAYGPKYRMVGMVLSNEAEVLNAVGRAAEALPLFEKAVKIVDADMGPGNRWAAFPLTGNGLSLVLLGRPREALVPLERALAIRATGEALPLPRAETSFALARALWDAGVDRPRAVTLAESARSELRRVPAAARKAAEVDGWLAAHTGAPLARRAAR
jgi:tRNA A-37 threonylcarbamoyl transferase component Bud32/tetratricopeptide (TPR) repeat protein